MSTPLRRAIAATSALQASICDGIQGLQRKHRGHLAAELRGAFADSLDLDAALLAQHTHENRWDYLLGHALSEHLIGLEPHSAKNDEVSTVIRKRSAAIAQLRGHLRAGEQVHRWFWVASGNVEFLPFDRQTLRLAEHGITFVGKRLLTKHIDDLAGAGSRAPPKVRSRGRPRSR
jgi:hypothetical protein